MKMNANQSNLVDLTIELEEKTKEYNELCEELEGLKQKNLDPNSSLYAALAEKFIKNQNEIKNILNQLKQLKKA